LYAPERPDRCPHGIFQLIQCVPSILARLRDSPDVLIRRGANATVKPKRIQLDARWKLAQMGTTNPITHSISITARVQRRFAC
jgi:hypothetical protein